jgi:hypothetical protein
MNDFSLSATSMGRVHCFLMNYAVMNLPGGHLADRSFSAMRKRGIWVPGIPCWILWRMSASVPPSAIFLYSDQDRVLPWHSPHDTRSTIFGKSQERCRGDWSLVGEHQRSLCRPNLANTTMSRLSLVIKNRSFFSSPNREPPALSGRSLSINQW